MNMLDGSRFENQYPPTSRESEIKEILGFARRGQSCQLISVPGAGRSTVLRLLAYNGKVREHHLKNRIENYLFVYLNFAEMPSFESAELTKALFLATLASIREQGPKKQPETTIGKEIYAMFKEALSLNDGLVLSQTFRKSVQKLHQNGIKTIFLFDRFSEFAEKVSAKFFTSLNALRIALVFSTHRPLEELLPQDHWGDLYEPFVGNHVFLELYDKVATDFRIGILEKEYGKKLPPATKQKMVKATGGHGKLMKLATQLLLQKKTVQSVDTMDTLLENVLIRGSLLEIWQGLTREERQALREERTGLSLEKLGLPFPLLEQFVRRNIAEELVPKKVRFDEKANEIYFGDEPIEGLTAYEFRLLRYLLAHPNRVVERDEVIQAVWSDNKTQAGVSDEALDQMIHRVRKKIEDEADNPKHLLTVKGRGFRFIP